MLSFWEKRNFSHFDIVVIGGGISGTSSAISLKKKYPNKSILVVERGILPTGASTKNAGFACFGSLTEILSDIKKMGENKALQLVEMRLKGLTILRERLGDDNLNFIQNGGYELIIQNENYENELNEINTLLERLGLHNTFQYKTKQLNDFGFNKKRVNQLLYNPYEGQIDSGLMMKNLGQYAKELGVVFFNNTAAKIDQIDRNQVKLNLSNAYRESLKNISCSQLIVCTNAFTKEIFPKEDFLPGRGQVIITKPIDNLKFKGIFHFDEGFYYFRNFGKRVIFGGGRNNFFEQEQTTEINTTENVVEHLSNMLKELILPDTDYNIDYAWSGIMAFGTEDKFPVIKKMEENVILAGRLSGMGIAIGSYLGEEVAKMVEII